MENPERIHPSPGAEAGRAPVSRASCWHTLQRWLLLAGFAYLGIISWVRLAAAVTDWQWLEYAKITPGPLYLAITGGLWGIIALVALVWILLRRPWHRLVGVSAALFFALSYWIDRLFVSAYPGGTGNTPFAIFLTLILVSYVFLVLRPVPELRALRSK